MALLLRHLRSLGAPCVLLALVVGIVTAAAVAAPRQVDRTATGDLRERLAAMSAPTRDLASSRGGPVPVDPPAGDPLDGLRADLATFAEEAPAPLSGALGEPGFVLRTTPETPTLPRESYQSLSFIALGDPSAVRLIEGRLPTALPGAGPGARVDPGQETAPSYEIALSVATAERLGWSVGDRIELAVPRDSVSVVAGMSMITGSTVTLVGLVEATDPDADLWRHAGSILQPYVFDDGDSPVLVRGAALVDPAYFVGTAANVEIQAWLPLDPRAVDVGNAESLHAALRSFASASFNLTTSEVSGHYTSLRFGSRSSETIEAALDRRGVAVAVLAVAAAGPVGVALVVLVVGLTLLQRRQHPLVVMLAARGGSPEQLRGALGLVGLLVGAPAALFGLAVGTLAVPDPGGGSPWRLGVAVCLLVGLLPAAWLAVTAPVGRLTPRVSGPETQERHRTLRILAELGLLVLAAAALLGLLQGGAVTGVDWLLVATPLLLGLLVAVVVLRLTEAALELLTRLGHRRAGLIGFVGPARARREPADAATTLAVLVLGASTAVFSAAVLMTLRAGVRRGVAAAEAQGVEPTVTPDAAAFTGLTGVLAAAVLTSLLLVAVAMVLAAAVSRESRERLIATLTVLGTGRAQLRAVALWEVLPVLVAGLLGGVLLGLGLPVVVEGLDLTAFTGEDTRPAPVRPLGIVLALAAAFGGCTLVVRLLASARARRAEPAPLFRSTEV